MQPVIHFPRASMINQRCCMTYVSDFALKQSVQELEEIARSVNQTVTELRKFNLS